MSSMWLLTFLLVGTATAASPVMRKSNTERVIQITPDGDVQMPGKSIDRAVSKTSRVAMHARSLGAPNWMVDAAFDQADPHESLLAVVGLIRHHSQQGTTLKCREQNEDEDNPLPANEVGPCQRPDGILSEDEDVVTSNLAETAFITEQIGDTPAMFCHEFSDNPTACETAFTHRKCSKTWLQHTVYSKCVYDANGISSEQGIQKKCFASASQFTVPKGVLKFDDTRFADPCKRGGAAGGKAGRKTADNEKCLDENLAFNGFSKGNKCKATGALTEEEDEDEKQE